MNRHQPFRRAVQVKVRCLLSGMMVGLLIAGCTTPNLPASYPTQADGSPNAILSYYATPAPEELVVVGEITETQFEPGASTRFSIENKRTAPGAIYSLYLTDNASGTRLRLGDDSGSAVFGTLSDEYILWYFVCNPCQKLKQGLYASTLDGETTTFVGESIETTQGSVKIAGEWVVHLYIPHNQSYISQLYAFNLLTGESLLLAEDAYWNTGNSPYYAVNQGMVAWIRVGKTRQDAGLNVYDLETHTSQELPVPAGSPRYLSVGRNLLVWWDDFWRGYDLDRDALFTVPIRPPGWENVGIQQDGPVTVEDYQLIWPLKVNDQYHYFTAPVVPAEEKPAAVAPVATPVGAPTRIPLGIAPTSTPAAEAYA